MRYSIYPAFILLAGCLQTGPGFVWQNPHLSTHQVESQRTIDLALCDVQAHHAVPLPALPAPRPENQDGNREYTVSGSIRGHNTYGTTYSSSYTGTITEKPAYNQNAFQQGMEYAQDSYARDLQTEQYETAVKKRSSFAEACMLKIGWMKVKIEN